MKQLIFIITLLISGLALGYEGPSPLRDVKIESSVLSENGDILKYSYKITNPSSNDGEIYLVHIFLPHNKKKDLTLSAEGLSHCKEDLGTTFDVVNEERGMLPVGSEAPTDWSCGYGNLAGYKYASYGWGSSSKSKLMPGKSISGLEMYSRGLPAIREILIEPEIILEKLPPEYDENVEKTVALENKVKWMGKTIGPKAPAKIFKAEDFIHDILEMKDKSLDLGWIKNSGIAKSFESKLESASKKIQSGDKKAAIDIIKAFISDVEAQKNKQLTPEAYALIYYNADYLLKQLQNPSQEPKPEKKK